jgi:hypothetical protein
MSISHELEPAAHRSLQVVQEMLHGYRFDEACVFLFRLNKWHIEEWVWVKSQLLSSVSSKILPMVNTIIKCSASTDLSTCEALVPGLSQYSVKHNPVELFD